MAGEGRKAGQRPVEFTLVPRAPAAAAPGPRASAPAPQTGAPAAPGRPDEDAADPAGTAARPVVPTRRLLPFVFRVLFRHRFLLFLTVLASFGVAASEIATVSLLLPILEALHGGEATLSSRFPLAGLLPDFSAMTVVDRVRWVAIGLVVVQLVRGVFAYAESRISAYMRVLFERDLRQMVFDEILDVELGYVQREKAATLFTLMHSYPRQASKIADEYIGTLHRGILFVTYVWMMFFVSWKLTLVAITLGLLSMWAMGGIRRAVRRLGRTINAARLRLHHVTLESLHGMKVLRLFAREEFARKRFLDEVKALQRESFRSGSLSAAAGPAQQLVGMTMFAGILVLATVTLDRSSDDWLLLLTVFILIMARLSGPINALGQRQTRIAAELPALEEIVAFLEQPKPRLRDGSTPFRRLEQGVRFEDVAYAYRPDLPSVLRGVSFDLPRGRTVAIVGASGAGKSTVVTLLARLADPTSGRILVDGVDLRELQGRTWRSRIAVVSQDTFLFHASVRENIRFGRLDATDAEVEEAARKAHAHEFVLALDRGYDTLVGDRGVRLSGGQAQRISVARALLADPEILVLDEATSALDSETERQVQLAIAEVTKRRTVLAVAHRLATVRDADEIVVVEGGAVVERGTHAELVERDGLYARYARMQGIAADP